MKSINKVVKISLAILLIYVFSVSLTTAQNDTLYIMKDGVIIGQYDINTEIDSIIFYNPVIEEATSGTFIDVRDNNKYNWIKIGNQIWMADNLKYLPDTINSPSVGSYTEPCYYVYGYYDTNVNEAKATDNYNTYGVLYNWTAACISCPTGWHLPSDEEWYELENYLIANDHNYDGSTTDNKIAISMATPSGWNEHDGAGTIGNSSNYPKYQNKSGFSALPGGYRYFVGNFYGIDNNGQWWSSSKDINSIYYYYRSLNFQNIHLYRNGEYPENGYSVRCVKN